MRGQHLARLPRGLALPGRLASSRAWIRLTCWMPACRGRSADCLALLVPQSNSLLGFSGCCLHVLKMVEAGMPLAPPSLNGTAD